MPFRYNFHDILKNFQFLFLLYSIIVKFLPFLFIIDQLNVCCVSECVRSNIKFIFWKMKRYAFGIVSSFFKIVLIRRMELKFSFINSDHINWVYRTSHSSVNT